jgi:hypothetical protein
MLVLLSLLVALSLLWALRWPMSVSLGCYLVAQLLYQPFVLLAWTVVGPSAIYGWVYSIFTALILAAVVRLAWESMAGARHPLLAVASSLLLTEGYVGIAVVNLGRPLQWADWIILAEGAVLFWAATIIGMSAPYSRPRWPDVSIGLSVLWIMQSLLDLGRCMHYPQWNEVIDVASPVVGAAGFLYLGWRLRSASIRRHLAAGIPSQAVP